MDTMDTLDEMDTYVYLEILSKTEAVITVVKTCLE